jgi:hypothetical protein
LVAEWRRIETRFFHVHDLARTGTAWISETRLRGRVPALRACITNFDSGPGDLARLVDGLLAALA